MKPLVLAASADIAMGGPGPEMTRFTAGVADGVGALQAPDDSSCDEVRTAVAAADEKVQ